MKPTLLERIKFMFGKSPAYIYEAFSAPVSYDTRFVSGSFGREKMDAKLDEICDNIREWWKLPEEEYYMRLDSEMNEIGLGCKVFTNIQIVRVYARGHYKDERGIVN